MNRWISSLMALALAAMVLGIAVPVLAQDVPAEVSAVVDLNRADVSELTSLPGIGPSRAEAIVEYRAAHGDFERVEDLTVIRGIGDKMLEQLKDRITVSPGDA